MNVKLIAITESKILEAKTAEELIAYIAKVSNPKYQDDLAKADRLLTYCIDHAHWSIFEQVDITLEINTTRDIARQILRHRSFTFQEFSQRYADVTQLEKAFTFREARLQDPKNRQNSIELLPEDISLANEWEQRQRDLLMMVEEAYSWALENGIAKEQARAVLPEGLTMSRMYMKGNLRNWIHYFAVRTGNGTQKEHIDIATECMETVLGQFPNIRHIIEAYVAYSKDQISKK